MSYEKKALSSLDKIIDAIFYEEGRLAIINKYGASLDDADKVKATELITKQRANLDRLFGIYKEQLEPVMADIDVVSEEMTPLVNKLLSTQKTVSQVVVEQPAMVVAEENAVAASEVAVDTPVAEAGANVAVDESAAVVEGGAEEVIAATPVEEGAAIVSDVPAEGVADNSVVDDANAVAVGGDVPAVNADAVAVNDAPGESGTNNVEESTEFVLSPIDEDVAPANSEEKAEEGAAVVDQQLQAIDAVKDEISNNPDLTADEKKAELDKYTRVSDAAVKAILVTKAQYEKLLASKASQKALLNPEKAAAEATAVDGIPAIVGGDTPAEVKNDEAAAAVVLPTIDNTNATDTPVASEAAADTAGAPVLPVIEGAPVANDAANVGEENNSAGEGVVLPTIVPGGDAPADVNPALATTEVVDKQKELQTMIDQANNLYKEGRTQEAQELFDKVGAINKEMQAGAAPAADSVATDTPAVEIPAVETPAVENTDAAVLVKK